MSQRTEYSASKARLPVFTKRFRDEVDKIGGISKASEKLNISRPTISYWYYGARTPDAENLIKISTVFDVSVDYLLGLDMSPTRAGDKQKAEVYTGLSAKAVDNLHNFMGSIASPLHMKWFDRLIASDLLIELSDLLAEYAAASLRSAVDEWRKKKREREICSSGIPTISVALHIGDSLHEMEKNNAGWKLTRCVVGMTESVDETFKDGIIEYVGEIAHLFESGEDFKDFCDYVNGGEK